MNKFLNMDKTNFLYGTLIATLIAIILSSCGPSKEEMEAKELRESGNKRFGNYDVEVIDGCEYLTAGSIPLNWHVITHKGNCHNPIHYKSQN
jgi:hypothetical protein